MACWKSQSFLEIAVFNFFRRSAQCNLSLVGWEFEVEPWKGGCSSRREACISGAWRTGLRKASRAEGTGHVVNCVLKYCLPFKTFIPVFAAFFVLLGIALSCICKMSFQVTSAKREFTPAIVSLSTSREVDI